MAGKTVYILGHKNPDVDSICSSIAYAEYKKAMGFPNYVAARCGNSNARIDMILRKFGFELPEFVGDVRLRAENVMKRDFLSLGENVSCYSVMETIDKYDLRTVPLLNSAGKLLGEVSVFDLGEFFIPRPREVREVRRLRATLRDVINTLNATVHVSFREDDMEDLYVRIGAMEVSSFDSFIEGEKLPPENNLIVVGDRFDIQIKAIQIRVRGIIITGGYGVDSSVLSMARANSVSVVSCPYDSATTALMVRMATRARSIMRTELAVVKPAQLLSGIAASTKKFFGKTIYVCDDSGKLLGVFSYTDLIDLPRPKIALVDHNELSQAVTGAEEAEIVEIVDHHRIGSVRTNSPILFINEPVGSTCTIISRMFARSGIKPSPSLAGLLLSGIVSDTLNLRSPTATSEDSAELDRLSKIAGISGAELSGYIFGAGSVILSSSADDIVRSDCKLYEENSNAFSVSQIEDLDYDNFFGKIEDIRAALERFRAEKNLLFSALFVTNVTSQDSLLMVCGSEEFISRISFARDPERGCFELPKMVSRKKQLVPYLSTLLREPMAQ